MKTNIEISAHHLHLTDEDFKKLFGKNDLTIRNYLLSSKGEFAANEVVELVGPKDRLHNVRIAGPFRDHSQVELSKTDAINMGIDAPLHISGSREGARIRIIGPKGEFTRDIAMIAKRHLHISNEIAEKLKLKSGHKVKIKITGERGLIFENVIVRVNEKYFNHFHIDTDEGNAAGIERSTSGEIILN